MNKILGFSKARLIESTALTGRVYKSRVCVGLSAVATAVFLTGCQRTLLPLTCMTDQCQEIILEINLDTTLSYSNIIRVNSPSAVLTGPANANGSEGDINFAHGVVSNQFEVLPILDIKDGEFGAHFSGEAYINTSYLGTIRTTSPTHSILSALPKTQISPARHEILRA